MKEWQQQPSKERKRKISSLTKKSAQQKKEEFENRKLYSIESNGVTAQIQVTVCRSSFIR